MRLRTIMTIVFCISALAPLALFWLWPQSKALENEIENARDRHLVIARNLTETLDQYHTSLVSTFDYVISGSDMKLGGEPQVKLLEQLDIISLCSINQQTGKVIQSVDTTRAKCPESFTKQQLSWMQGELGDTKEKTVMSGLVQTKSSGNVISLLHAKNDLIYVGTVSRDTFKRIGESIRFGQNGHAFIVDKNGIEIYHPKNQKEVDIKNHNNMPIVQDAMADNSGVQTYFSPIFNQDMIAGYSKAARSGLIVIVPQPLHELEAKALENKETALTVLAIGFALAIILAYIASKIITHPIEEMLLAMRRIGTGELWAHEKMKLGRFQPKEFGDARASIKNMAETLQENIDTISRHAYLDGITGLPNRECFRVLAQEEIDKLSISGNSGALLFLDLDGFKQVNDVYGHRAGDDLLLAFSQRLHEYCGVFMKRYARGVDNALTVLPARLGGDEFVVFLGNIAGPETTAEFANQLFTRVFGKFNLHNGIQLDISGSVGGAIFPTQAGDFDELLRLADIAMYEAKNSGKGRYCLHSDVEDYFENISSEERFEVME